MIWTTNLQITIVTDTDDLVTISDNYGDFMGDIAFKGVQFQQLQDFQGHFGKWSAYFFIYPFCFNFFIT